MKNRIIAIHLLNDLSGSPFVLRQALEVLVKDGHKVHLFTSTPSGHGFLSNIDGTTTVPIFYQWNKNRWLTLVYYMYSQLNLFIKILTYLKKGDTLYINSILPFGAAIAGYLRGNKTVYHFHEVSVKPLLLRKFLLAIADHCATIGLFVSQDLAGRTRFNKPCQIVYNSLPESFIQLAMKGRSHPTEAGPFNVLMICSLKKYKGVDEFVQCAAALPRYTFSLVLNAAATEIESYFDGRAMPANLRICPAQKNVHPFYEQSRLVMNLSKPEEWIETFGMTILEGMYYGKPAIVPTTGGITELISDGEEGFRIDSSNLTALCSKISALAEDPLLYASCSKSAASKALSFGPDRFRQGILSVFHGME
jgi:L-malate glycosyltransferase